MSRASRFRAVALLGAFLVLAAILAMSTWSFVKPANVRAEVRLAPVGDFQLGSVTPYRIDEDRLLAMGQLATYFGSSSHGAASSVLGDTLLYVVRLPDGDFRVLSGRSTHLGQVIEWKPDFVPEVGKIRGAFFGWGSCPLWAVDGTRIFGPAPRDMDRYSWHLDDGVLVVEVPRAPRRGVAYRPRNVPRDASSVRRPR